MTSPGFAVVDVETTGLYPTKDRIVEVAIVHVDASGSIGETFCTVIDPQRDVGPTRIHGLTASAVFGAPTFAEASPTVWQWLTGKVFVAHNVRFDLTFLGVEFERCGLHLPPPPVMCTMNLSGSYLTRLSARTLSACCEAAGIKLANHHSALDDALAAAQLLACYRTSHSQLPHSWEVALGEATDAQWSNDPIETAFHPFTRADQVVRQKNETTPLAGLVHRLPRGPDSDTEHYLGVLDRILEDRIITGDELTELSQLAATYGVTRDSAERAHREYLGHVATAAWIDTVVTKSEQADFIAVARLVDVPVDEALAILEASRDGATSFPVREEAQLMRDDRVVFTGEMEHGREQLEEVARAVGLRVTSAVSSKTALVVVADPHSQSGKARKARALGVRTVTEPVFFYLTEQLRQRSLRE